MARHCSPYKYRHDAFSRVASIVFIGLRVAPLYGITHVVEHKDCEGGHALPLFGTKRFVEGLPSLGELIQIG